MDQKKYDVFISYSRKDYKKDDVVIPENIVSKVKDSLKDAGISYWFDEDGIYSGDTWAKKILNSIKASRVLVFIASESANKSPFTRKEIASANEFHIPILPFRLDDTPYDEDVLFRIIDLQYVAYYKKPEESLKELVEAIKTKLAILQEEEERKEKEEELKRRQAVEEEHRRQAEEEDRKRKEQQQKDIEAIRLACSKLNNEEKIIEVDRSNLLLEAKAKVKDPTEQEKLMNDIINSSPIRKKSEQAIQQLRHKIESLENELKSLQQEKENLIFEIDEKQKLVADKELLATNIEQKYQNEVKRLENQVAQQQSELIATKNQQRILASQLAKSEEQLSITEKKLINNVKNIKRGFRWWIHLVYVILLVFLFCGWLASNSKMKELQQLCTDKTTIKTTETPIKTDTTITMPTAPRLASDMEVDSKNLKKYLYTGPLNADGKPEGKGRAVFPNKDTFEGTFINGKLAKGRYTFAKDGTYFLGNFTENEKPDTTHGAYYKKNGEKIN